MLRILLAVSRDGLLRRFEAEGHAGAGFGNNIACAAATTLLRTAGRACTAQGIAADGGAARPAHITLELAGKPAGDEGWLRGVTDFLVRGLSDLSREFPDQVALRIETLED